MCHSAKSRSVVCISAVLFALMAILAIQGFTRVNATKDSSAEKVDHMLNSAFHKMKNYGFKSGHIYFPQSIPEGFTVSEIDVFPDACWIDFASGDSTISFRQMAVSNFNRFSVVYDTKNAEKAKKIMIEGYDAYLVKSDGRIKISYCNDDYFFTITYHNVDEPQAIRFASDLKRIALDELAAKASG